MISNNNAGVIKIPSWRYEEIEKKVVDLYIEQSITKIPIDPFEIINKRGYIKIPFSKIGDNKIFKTNREEKDAFSFYSPTDKTFIIVYDDEKPLLRLRFTLMHEIGHIDLGHRGESDLAKKEADYYAGYALAPSPLISLFSREKKDAIGRIFWVSPDCASICKQRYEKWLQYGGNYLKDYEEKLIDLFI